jgi:carbon-monoxide dehydrogenase medium subunit
MIPSAFQYTRASSLDEALRTLASAKDAKVIAGGQSLVPLMKLRLARPDRLVDIGGLKELKGIRKLADGRLAIGALTTYREILDHKEAMHYGVLRDCLPIIGDVQVRNRGTIGGSLAHADPASDLPAALLALDAEIVARSASGERRIKVTELFAGPFESTLRSDELLVEVVLPAPVPVAGSAYTTLMAKSSGYAIVGVGSVIVPAKDGTIAWASVALTGVSDVPYRASKVEAAIIGKKPSAELFRSAAAHATDGTHVNSDIHAARDYRTAMAAIHVARSLETSLSRSAAG